MSSKNTAAPRAPRQQKPLFNQANEAWDKGDLNGAFTLFMESASLGDAGSQVDLGYFFDNGLSVKKDKKKALVWYRKAYLQGDVSGANNIATVYRDLGETKKMLWWFRRAAEMGDVDVMLDLGRRYEKGAEVPKNVSTAKNYYRRVLLSKYATDDDKAQAKARLLRLKQASHR